MSERCESVRPGYTDQCERPKAHPGQHWARYKAVRWGGALNKRSDLARSSLDRDLARDKSARKRAGRRGPACSVCLEPGELENGRCKDTQACRERAPQLDLGLEA